MRKIPRHLLPQISQDDLDEFEDFLHKNGVPTENTRRPTDWFMPIQSEYNKDKVTHLMKNSNVISNAPIIATQDGFIIDGHHRWLAADRSNIPSMDCIICRCELPKMLQLAHKFGPSYVKSVHELTIYSKLALLHESKNYSNIRNLIRNIIREELNTLLEDQPEESPEGDPEELTYDDGYGYKMKYSDADETPVDVPSTI